MKSSYPVIRVSGLRARDLLPSMTSLLDRVQVRASEPAALHGAAGGGSTAPVRLETGDSATELSECVTCRIL